MPTPLWSDIFKTFTYAFADDPLNRRLAPKDLVGAGIVSPDSIPSISPDGSYWNGSDNRLVRLRETQDFIDLSTVSNRISRYKEYERLRAVPEIETCLTIFSDEACVAGNTKVATPFGYKTIKELTENHADDKFLVYCYDFEKKDYTIGWGHHPRKTKKAETIKLIFDNGSTIECTPDHKLLLASGEWIQAEDVKLADEFMAFYREKPYTKLNTLLNNQHPRIMTNRFGWINERHFVDYWRTNKFDEKTEKIYEYTRLIQNGHDMDSMLNLCEETWVTIKARLKKAGFNYKELKHFAKSKSKIRKVVGKFRDKEQDVYDLTVEDHHNFATDSIIVHNCQKDETGNVLKISCKNDDVRKEVEFLLLSRQMLNFNKRLWPDFKSLLLYGDLFYELVTNLDNPADGILKIQRLPPESIYRIETTKGKVVEFQQSKEGPDYQSLVRAPVTQATDQEIQMATAIRFAPEQVVHVRINEDRKQFYPYGSSVIEPARGPAYQLRLMEDSMLTYRLARAPERRVFYIDVGQLPGFKAEAFIERMKDQFRKRKISLSRGTTGGASSIDERYQPPAVEEDFWIPTRPNSNTKIETLPGACLALDTEIALLDGRNLKLSEIIAEYKSGKELWVYSINPKTGETVPGPITWAGVTRKNAKVVKINLDNGKSVICTPDHKFPVQGREGKIEAQNLSAGDSLWAFNTRNHPLRSNRKDEYSQVYDNYSKKWMFTHRLVAEYMKTKNKHNEMVHRVDDVKNTVHHIDFNKFNNNPDNLAWMNFSDHVEYHGTLPKFNGPQISIGLKAYHENLSDGQKSIRDEILAARSERGTLSLQEKLKDETFNQEFRNKQIEGWKKAKEENTESYQSKCKKMSERNKTFWSDPENKKKVFAKQTVVYPESMFSLFKACLQKGMLVENIIIEIINNTEVMKEYAESNTHIKREGVRFDTLSKDHINKMCYQHGFQSIRELRKSLNDGNLKVKGSEFYGNNNINFPQKMFARFMKLISEDKTIEETLANINSDKEIKKEFIEKNKHVKRKTVNLSEGLKKTHIQRMIKQHGYDSISHAKEHSAFYNHKVVSVEFLENTMDTGTITVDGMEEYHCYHTFAIADADIYLYNSNLGEIDDAIYFRLKLMTALNFPKNYLNVDDPAQTKITLSSQDVKFARTVERYQSCMEDGIFEITQRHLHMRGFPEETYEDLKILMTPPSEWRELSRAEITNNRIQNVTSLKSSQLISDFDLLTTWMHYTEEDAKGIIGRMKIQKLEDARLQVLQQNPQLLGVGVPSSDEQEVGTTPEGPNQQVTPEQPGQEIGAAPEMPPTGEQGATPTAAPTAPQGQQLPEPSDEDIEKYDLGILDYAAEEDVESQDYSAE